MVAWFDMLANITLVNIGLDVWRQALPVVLIADEFDSSSYAVMAASDLIVVVTHEDLIT
jgi:hypothetical protein